MIHTENILERGIIYYVYEHTTPFKETDHAQLQQMKDEDRKFLYKRAICTCGIKKQSKRMQTSFCKKCNSKIARKKHDKLYHIRKKEAKENAFKINGKESHGNSIWL